MTVQRETVVNFLKLSTPLHLAKSPLEIKQIK